MAAFVIARQFTIKGVLRNTSFAQILDTVVSGVTVYVVQNTFRISATNDGKNGAMETNFKLFTRTVFRKKVEVSVSNSATMTL